MRITQLTADFLSKTEMLSRPRLSPSSDQLGQSFSSKHPGLLESQLSHLFLCAALLSTKDFGQQIGAMPSTSEVKQLTNDGMPKHPKVIPTQRAQPAHQTAGGPRTGHANGKERILTRHTKKWQVLSSTRLTFHSSRSHQSGKTLGACTCFPEFRGRFFSPTIDISATLYNPAISPSHDLKRKGKA